MLKITLNNFRCWENIHLEINIGSITLIKGGSGIGKTTIFQAIAWCLYGNIRLVAPNHHEKAKTFVSLEFPHASIILKISRYKNPNRLLVSFDKNSYEDKLAQSYIDNIFGTYEIWLASCYIGQGCKNNFLTSPNSGKMELLNTIAFHEEDPASYIEKIDNNIIEKETFYKNKLQEYKTNIDKFQALISNIDVSKSLTEDQISNIKSELIKLQEHKLNLLSLKSKRDVDIGILFNLETQLNKLETKQIIIPELPSDLITIVNKLQTDDHEQIVQKLYSYITLLQRRDDLITDVKKYDNILLPFINIDKTQIYTQDDYHSSLSQELALKENQKLAQSLSVPYSRSNILNTILQYENNINSQERLKLERNISNLRNKLEIFEKEYIQYSEPIQIPEIIPIIIAIPNYSDFSTSSLEEEVCSLSNKLNTLSTHLELLQKGTDVIKCPHCKGNLRYQKGCLICADTNPTNFEEIKLKQKEISNVTNEINNVNNKIQLLKKEEVHQRNHYERSVSIEQKRLESLNVKVRQLELENQKREITKQNKLQQISDIKYEINSLSEKLYNLPEIKGDRKILTDLELSKLRDNIAKLNNINIIETPKFSSSYIKSFLTYQNLLQEQKNINNLYQSHLSKIPSEFRTETVKDISTYIEKFKIFRQQTSSLIQEKNKLDQQKQSLLSQITDFKSKIIADPILEIENVDIKISAYEEMLSLNIKAQEVINFHAKLTKEHEDVNQLNQSVSDLQTFKQYAIETECKILQQIVDSINTCIQNVCTTMFDKDININLSLFKTMKTTKNVKPVVNFFISYQGGSFDNINQLSGGEVDRTSLSLTLALNRLSGCPLLMLDESLASLDLNMKEAAIKTIRENTNATVLIIMHDGIEGCFDDCIDLSEINLGRF